jgi:dTDP-4-amino-4,6-dideoxygalactose transaminase
VDNHTIYKDGKTINRQSGKHIIACIPMHTFGNVCRIEELLEICNEYNIQLIEDAAESLGSLSNNKHTGTFGVMGAISFNGNKIITTGGGGMIITDDENLAIKAKHITTTAKIAHPYEYNHDQIGFNYRMPNLNAALGKAQVENLDYFIKEKRLVAKKYMNFFDEAGVGFVTERAGTVSNYWLNAILLSNSEERDSFIKSTNKAGVMTRPIWTLMTDLDMFKDCQHDDLSNSIWLQARVVNIPSSVPNML